MPLSNIRCLDGIDRFLISIQYYMLFQFTLSYPVAWYAQSLTSESHVPSIELIVARTQKAALPVHPAKRPQC